MPITRRNFIKLTSVGLLGGLASHSHPAASLSRQSADGLKYQGDDLTGWATVLGDAIYAAPGESPVTAEDIETMHNGSYSELRANIQLRRIMAHNVTYLRIPDVLGLSYIYTGGFQFRLPFIPEMGNFELNAQSLEGGMFVWDGAATRLDYGLAFQWILNPWDTEDAKFGTMRCWTDTGDGQWDNVGYLEPDTAWHEVKLVLDIQRQTTAFLIDGSHFPTCFTSTPKPADWGAEIAPGLQVEIVSLYPGEVNGALHKAEFRDWYWNWESYNPCTVFLPVVKK